MNARILILLGAASILALGQTTTEVKPNEDLQVILANPATVAEIKAASEDLDKAMEALAKAQADVKAASNRRANAIAVLNNTFSVFEGHCVYPDSDRHFSAGMYHGQREFKRIELRGKYILVTRGREACGGSGPGWIINGTGTIQGNQLNIQDSAK